jgi:hypothetical protein
VADTSSLVKVGLFGGAAYLAYKFYFAPPSVPAGAVAPVPAAAGASSVPSAGGSPAPPSNVYNSLAAVLGRIASAATSAGLTSQTPDEWNVLYLAQGGPAPAPDPMDVFGGRPEMTLAQYWAGMSAYLARTRGLAGMGIYAGLGRLAFGGGR